jgi:hypothetical protein
MGWSRVCILLQQHKCITRLWTLQSRKHRLCTARSAISPTLVVAAHSVMFSRILQSQERHRWFQACAAMHMNFALFWDITQRWVVVLYRRFGTTYRSNLQGSRSPRRKLSSWTSWPLKKEPIGCPETSVQNYHSNLRNITEKCRTQEANTFPSMTDLSNSPLTGPFISASCWRL